MIRQNRVSKRVQFYMFTCHFLREMWTEGWQITTNEVGFEFRSFWGVDIVTNVKMIDNKIRFNKVLSVEVGFGPERGFILCLVSRWVNF